MIEDELEKHFFSLFYFIKIATFLNIKNKFLEQMKILEFVFQTKFLTIEKFMFRKPAKNVSSDIQSGIKSFDAELLSLSLDENCVISIYVLGNLETHQQSDLHTCCECKTLSDESIAYLLMYSNQ